jgi:hypothetical protein
MIFEMAYERAKTLRIRELRTIADIAAKFAADVRDACDLADEHHVEKLRVLNGTAVLKALETKFPNFTADLTKKLAEHPMVRRR